MLIFASTRVYSNVYNSNRYIPTAIFQTPISQRLYFKRQCLSSLYIQAHSPHSAMSHSLRCCFHLKMSRLSRLDSSSSSDDDDEPELTLGALHQAHRRYLSMHSSQWGALYLAGNIFIAIEKLDIEGCTMTIFQKLQHMMHLSFGAGM